MATPHQIVRCLKRDMSGDLPACVSYAEKISRSAAMNPWSPAEDSSNYAEAVNILKRQISEQNTNLMMNID